MLHEYLELANGWNARFLEQLRKEGVRRHMLQNLNELGVVLVQPKPITSSSHLLTQTLALITAHGMAVYSEEAMREADKIQQMQAQDEQVIYFTLQQLDEEAERAKTMAVVTDVLSTRNLYTVFPRLKHTDRRMHEAALGLLLEEAAENPMAHLYGKDDVLPLDCWQIQVRRLQSCGSVISTVWV